jgi:hypothetical protein
MSHNQESQLKLRPTLVPEPLQRRSVFYALQRNKEWRKIREAVKLTADGACEICGTKRDRYMVCHEDWHYDDKKHIATMFRFMWICPDCNGVLHLKNLSNIDLLFNVIAHLMRVNEIKSDKGVFELLSRAQHEYDERSQHEWTIVINSALLDRFPILAELQL